MPNPRELSQFGSFIVVNDTTKNIGIATSGTPFVGIGTLTPQEKLHVVGNLKVDGRLLADVGGNVYANNARIDNATIGVATITNIDIAGGRIGVTNLSSTHLVVSAGATIGSLLIKSGIVTSTSGIITYYGDAQYMQNVGLAVTYIDNNVTIGGTLTLNGLVLTGTGPSGPGIAASTLNITGISTLGGVKIQSGIITAGTGTTTVVYYGDGYNLKNIQCSALTGFKVAIYRRQPTGRWSLGKNIVKIGVSADNIIVITTRVGITTVSIGDAALPPLTVK